MLALVEPNVLFEENFTTDALPWFNADTSEQVEVDTQNGWQDLKGSSTNTALHYAEPNIKIPSAFQVRAVIEHSTGEKNGPGCIFGQDQKTSEDIGILFDEAGYFSIQQFGLNPLVTPWAASPAIKKGLGEKNVLLIKIWPGLQHFYINGQQVDTLRLELAPPRRFGVFTRAKTEGRVHSFTILETSAAETEQIETAAAERLEQAISELNEMVGMARIKDQIRTLTNVLRVQKKRSEFGLSTNSLGNHMVLLGPPGTGKTTVARILGEILHQLGILSKGHVVETDRSGLVGEYIGKTAPIVDEKVDEAAGGILFIDEAYTLKPTGAAGWDFGQEAIDTLMKRMEDNREDLVVIIAGYKDKMESFLQSNPGIQSRFNHHFEFIDYEPNELLEIFTLLTGKAQYKTTDEAVSKVRKHLADAYKNRSYSFGNGRYVRNLLDMMIQNQANRLASDPDLDVHEVATLEAPDVPVGLLSGTQASTTTGNSNQYL